MALLQPVFDQQQQKRETYLANAGIPISSQAYQTDYANRARAQNEALTSLANQSVAAGQQYQQNTLAQILSLLGYAAPAGSTGINPQTGAVGVQSLATPGNSLSFGDVLAQMAIGAAGGAGAAGTAYATRA